MAPNKVASVRSITGHCMARQNRPGAERNKIIRVGECRMRKAFQESSARTVEMPFDLLNNPVLGRLIGEDLPRQEDTQGRVALDQR